MCCVRIELVTPGLSEGGDFTTVNQPQTLLAGVAEPTDPASRIIADVWGGVQDRDVEMSQESQKQVH